MYGQHYCQAFNSINSKVSQKGRNFVTATRLCLQNGLKRWAAANPQGTCKQLTDFAFASHPACYTQRATSICFLSPEEQFTVAKVVQVQDLFTVRTGVQMAQTGAICLRQGANFLRREAVGAVRDTVQGAVNGVRQTAVNTVNGAVNGARQSALNLLSGVVSRNIPQIGRRRRN